LQHCRACVELTLEIQREQFDFSRAMPTLNLRTGMLGERDCLAPKKWEPRDQPLVRGWVFSYRYTV
jgi:hypothetical protein